MENVLKCVLTVLICYTHLNVGSRVVVVMSLCLTMHTFEVQLLLK